MRCVICARFFHCFFINPHMVRSHHFILLDCGSRSRRYIPPISIAVGAVSARSRVFLKVSRAFPDMLGVGAFQGYYARPLVQFEPAQVNFGRLLEERARAPGAVFRCLVSLGSSNKYKDLAWCIQPTPNEVMVPGCFWTGSLVRRFLQIANRPDRALMCTRN